jgi:GAF domain-containing protein
MSIPQSSFQNPNLRDNDRLTAWWHRLTSPNPSLSAAERGRAQLLSILSLILILLFVAAFLFGTESYGAFGFLFAITLASYALSRTRFFRAGIYLFTYAFTSFGFIRILTGGADSIEASVASTVHISLVASSVLLSRRGFAALTLLSVAATFAAPWYSSIPPAASESIGRTGGVLLVLGAILYGISMFRENLESTQRRELSENNRKLEDLRQRLETQIEEQSSRLNEASLQARERAERLRQIAQLSQEISSASTLGLQELLMRAAHWISERLGYYHVGIFLLDERREFAILRAANSAGGQRMLERHHQLKVGGTGIVGFVSQSGRPRIALDTGADAVFFNNPDLPDTRSEISLPLKVEEVVIGVLDVQSTEPSAFSEEDMNSLGILADLLAAVVENIQAGEGGRKTASFAGGRFISFKKKTKSSGYTFRAEGISAPMIPPESEPLIRKAVGLGEPVVANQPPPGGVPTLAVPVKLRDQVIGIIHIEAPSEDRKWTEDELSLVQAISDRAALALENARLFEDATRRAEQEETLARITSRIGSSTDFDRILQTTVQEIGQALGATRSYIQLGTDVPQEERS